MLHRPTNLSDAQVQELTAHLRQVETRLNRYVADVLEDVESEVLRNQLRLIAFRPNDLLPKRQRRPSPEIHHLVEQLYLAYDPDGEKIKDLLQLTLIFQEYYDIADDLIDGDVAEGSETEVLVTNELLLPHLVRFLGRLGDDIVEYWSHRASRMASSFAAELLHEPAAETYLDLVDRQSELYGVVTGLAAVAAGGSDEDINRAESIGTAYFKHEQFLLDLEQYDAEHSNSWNAWHLLSADEATEHIHIWQDEVVRWSYDLPENHAKLVRPLVAVDVDSYRDQKLKF